jgi:hypothetical protein
MSIRLQIALIALLVGTLALLAGQMRSGSGRKPMPAADLSSPESALLSYWSRREWVRRKGLDENPPKNSAPGVAEVMHPVTAGSTRASFLSATPPVTSDPLARSLLRVDQASATHAVAVAKVRNLLRDPLELTPTPIELLRDEPGTEVQYTLSKDAEGWKVSEVWRVAADGSRHRVR